MLSLDGSHGAEIKLICSPAAEKDEGQKKEKEKKDSVCSPMQAANTNRDSERQTDDHFCDFVKNNLPFVFHLIESISKHTSRIKSMHSY